MITDEKLDGKTSAAQVRDLLKVCGVAELPACKRAGMATSTLLRWRRGSQPKDGQLQVLRRAVLEVASDNGTLPAEYETELDQLRNTVELPAPAQEGELKRRVERLERVVVDQLGARL